MDMAGLKLIVGLGNPGAEHALTRHNAGYHFVDALAHQQRATWELNSKLFGQSAKINLNGQDLWLLKPTTFMNLSGKSVLAALQFWKIEPEQLLLAHDELAFRPGRVRLRFDGGHAGHGGVRDTMQRLGHGRFYRLRIGIGHPGHKDRVVAWVLNHPYSADEMLIARAINRALDILPLAATGEFERAMQQLHTAIEQLHAKK